MSPDDFNKLKKFWDNKLKKSGFNDIESENQRLKSWSSAFTRPRAVWIKADREAYYDLARRFLNEYKFKTPRERIIWEYHTEGITIRNIVKILKKVKSKGAHRSMVGEVVSRLSKIMKKMYIQDINE